MTGTRGLLLAQMEPHELHESEFNDWYDLEHLPQMGAVDGILAATRWLCVEGWPRYLALYDLDSIDVLKNESYRQATGANFTPWTRRVLSRVHGWRRIALTGLDAGAGESSGDAGALLLLFTDEVTAASALTHELGATPGVLQARAFDVPDEGFAAVVVEGGSLVNLPAAVPDVAASHVRRSARYVRYERRDPFAAFHAIDSGEVH
jgi:hypothetical protein